MYKGKKNFRQLKKDVKYIAKCYRKNIDRLLLDGYDNHKIDYVKQTHSDLEMVGYLNFVLELCSKESNLFYVLFILIKMITNCILRVCPDLHTIV